MSEIPPGAGIDAAANYADIAAALGRYLRARSGIAFADQDDLVQQTLLDFHRRSVELHKPRDAEKSRQIAFAILRRRIVDSHRQLTRSVLSEQFSEKACDAPRIDDVSDVVSYQQLLRKVLFLVARMNPRDQDLVLDFAQPHSRVEAWTAADRKQLSRLRDQLRRSLAEKFSIDIADALGNEE